MKYTSNYNLRKPEGTDIVNIDDLNENADIIDQKLKELEDGVNSAPPNSVNDAAIGSRTPDQSLEPASPGTGTLTQLTSWLANRINAITGKTNWWDEPPTTLQAAKTHMDAISGIHGATSSATANRLILRDSNGQASVADPTSSSHIATKGYVDSTVDNHANVTSGVHGATSSATANRIIARDSAGRAKVAAPSANDDIATKGYVDSKLSALPSGVPAGVIVMWSGSADNIPSGWALCDGSNGTPDLRDRFIVGAGGSYDVGDTGGAESVTLTVAQMPQHSHGASSSSAGSHTHSISTSSAGSHSHSASSSSTGGHNHKAVFEGASGLNRVLMNSTSGVDLGAITDLADGIWGLKGGSVVNTVPKITIDTSGTHQHTITVNSAGSHSHSGTAESAGSHSHSITVNNTGSSQPHENRPPYYALCFIMKL